MAPSPAKCSSAPTISPSAGSDARARRARRTGRQSRGFVGPTPPFKGTTPNFQELEADADAVDELGGAFLRDGDLILQRVGLDLLVLVARGQDLPVAGDGLDDGHGLGLALVVAEGDFPLDLVEVRGELLEILLRALADQVEGVAHLDLHALVLGRVVDPVLADELLAARAVGLVDTNLALGQRQAEAVLLAVLDLEVDRDLLVRNRHAVRVPVVEDRGLP